MIALPNPFDSVGAAPPPMEAAAAATLPAPQAAAVPFPAEGPVESPAVMPHMAAGAFDPEEYTANDEALYQHLKRSVEDLDDPPLFLRRYRTLR